MRKIDGILIIKNLRFIAVLVFMVNELYLQIITYVSQHIPPDILSFLQKYGPESLYSMINPHTPILRNIVHGMCYSPYLWVSNAALRLLMGIKKEDVYKIEFFPDISIGDLFLINVIFSFYEEICYRLVPSIIGRFFGGDILELVSLLVSSIIFSYRHTNLYFKNKKLQGFLTYFLASLIFTHTYLVDGFLAAVGSHIGANTISDFLLYCFKKFSRQDKL